MPPAVLPDLRTRYLARIPISLIMVKIALQTAFESAPKHAALSGGCSGTGAMPVSNGHDRMACSIVRN